MWTEVMRYQFARIAADAPDSSQPDILELVLNKGTVVDPLSQLWALEKYPASKVWVVDEPPLPLVFGQPYRKPY